MTTAGVLFYHGADIKAKDHAGWTVLHLATNRGDDETLVWLLRGQRRARDRPTIAPTGGLCTLPCFTGMSIPSADGGIFRMSCNAQVSGIKGSANDGYPCTN